MVSSSLLIHCVTTKTIFEVAFPRRCPYATACLAADGKVRASEIYGVIDNVNGAAARFINFSFNRSNLFSLLGGYMYYSHRCRQLHFSLSM
ncbi:hypothetical protein Bca4012_088672 [Brassica carinata]